MKKIMQGISVLIVLFAVLTVPVVADSPLPNIGQATLARAASTTVLIEDASAPQGGTVTVPIEIADVENMCGANIWLHYNKDVVIVDSVLDGDLVPLTHKSDNVTTRLEGQVLACASVVAAMPPVPYFSQYDSLWSNDGIYEDYSGGVVSAEDVSEYFTGSVADAKTQVAFAEDKIQSLSSQTEIFVGQGFDKCEIPTLSQMQNWITNSPYGAVNLYIGGSCRSCPNSALTASYVSQLSQQGWKFIPTWVGPQSACWVGSCGSRISNDPATAYNQGISEANAAIDVAIDLGLALADGSGTIIYYDLENYDTTNTACRNAAKSFISGWTAQLHARGSEAGVYGSSCGSEISDFASISNVPDAIWPAHWIYSSYNSGATVWDVKCLSNSLWANHQRIRQYAGGHGETWGGITLNIDCNVIDGIVASVVSVGPADIIPLTGDMYGNGKDITGFYNANTAEFTFGGETARVGQMADKLVMNESGTDTIGTYSASKAGFSFDGKTNDTVNIEFADQSAELGVVNLRGLPFGTQVGEYNGVIAYSNYENDYASWIYNFVDGYNTGMKWQCVEYVNRYYKAINGMEIRIPGTNANDYYGTASDRGLIAYPNGGTTSPQPGDILCSDGGSYGHVAIVREVTTGSIHVIHQNWANSGADNDKIISMSISGGHYTVSGFSASYPVQGWLRKPGGITQTPLTGDMYRSGTDTTGIYNTGTAEFTFGGKTVRFGQTNDEPIIGDWDGDGYDEIGLFRSSTSMFYLVTRNWETLPYEVGAADKDIPFSYPEDIPIAGDWDGDGDDDIGGYYPGTFYLYLLNLGSSTATSYRDVPFGQADDIPLIGDWDNDGDDDVAVCRKYDINNNPTYYFDLDHTGDQHELGPCEWGDNDDIPITGRWNAGSGDKIGVYRPSTEEFIRNYDIPPDQVCGDMGVSPTSWSPTIEHGHSDSQIVTVSASSGPVKGVTVSKESGPTWLSVSPTDLGDIASGSSKTFTMTASQPAGTSGDFAYTVRVSNTCGSPSSRDVTGTIHVVIPCGNMGVSPTSWSPTLNCGESDSQIVTVSASSGPVKGVTVSKESGPTWLSVSPTNLGDIASGSSKTFTMTASPPGGTSGDFTYTVRVSNTCGTPSSIDVTGTIHVECPSCGNMGVNPTSWSPPTLNCGDSDSQIVTVSATGGTVEGVTVSKISGETWLTLSQTNLGDIPSGSSETFTVTAAPPAGTSSGDYPFTIRVSNTCGTPSSRDVTGTIHVECPSCGNMGVNPTSWSTTTNCGGSDNEIVTVSATGGVVEGVTASKVSGPTWLTLSQTNLGDIPSGSSKTFTITASPPSETSGDFTYTVRVSNICGTPSTRDVSGTIHVDCIEPNQPPSYSNPSVSPGSGTPSTQFDYTVDVSDPDGDSVTVALKTYDPSDGSWEDQGNRIVVGSGTASWNDLTPFEVDDKGQTGKYTFVFDDGYNSGEWGPFNGPAIETDASFSNWDYPSISPAAEKIPVEVDISNPHGVKSAWLHYDYGDDGSEDGVTQMSLISVRSAKTEIQGGSSSGLGVKAQEIAVSESAPLSGGGGSGVAEREGIQKSIYLYDAKTCKDVDFSYPYDPIGVTTVFSPTDSVSYTWLQFNDIWSSHTVKWEWYDPNGNFYTDCTDMIPEPSDSGYDHWDWYVCCCGIYINGHPVAEERGIWTVKVYLDGGQIETLYFNIEYIIADYTMCKNVQASSPYDPIERTSTFLADDEKAISWLRLDDVTNSLNVRWDWYDPLGNPYYTWDLDTSDPADEGYDYWDRVKAWCYIPIKDYAAAEKPGLWVVKVYIWGEYVCEEEFTIYPDDARYKCEIPAPGMAYAGDEVSFYVSAYSAYDSSTDSAKHLVDIYVPDDPTLSIFPSSHDFGDKCEGETDSTTFEVWNSGTGTLTYSLSETCSWVDVNPTSGSSTGVHDGITVDIDTAGLSEGSYICNISISSNGGNGTFTVTVNIIPSTGSITVYSSPPGADIYLDNKYVGRTIYTITGVLPGYHTIKLTLMGYHNWTTNLQVIAGETVYVHATLTPLPKPDLIISEKWLCWPDNCTICYNVTNIGDGAAPACHNTTLYVDDVAVAHDHVPVDLAPGERYIGCFDGYTWTYTPPSDNVTVCADNSETLDEVDETNNCLTTIWKCGDVNCDSKVTMSDVRKVFNRYLDLNYPLDLPWAADVNGDGKVTMSDVRKVFNRYLDQGYELNCCCGGVG